MSVPVIDLEAFFNKDSNPEAYKVECDKVANALHTYGLLVIKDPRVFQADNARFLDMMERYFELSDGKRDARPDLSYQVGVTPSHVERARNHCSLMGAYKDDNTPLSPCPPEFDAKWRFFWRIGPQPETTKYPTLNMDPVVPPEFPEWSETMNMWGNKMMDAINGLSEMMAVGFGLPDDAFTSRMKTGPHLLAPTGSDFNTYNQKGHILAGFHSDLNFLTIHGKSRYPGLYAWMRDGTKIPVSVPEGCLLVQAGKQIEYLTAGHCMAGFHEVVINDATLGVIQQRKEEGKSLWRVSSTLFSHIESDVVLQPFDKFLVPTVQSDGSTLSVEDLKSKFPPMDTGLFVSEELKEIKLNVPDSKVA